MHPSLLYAYLQPTIPFEEWNARRLKADEELKQSVRRTNQEMRKLPVVLHDMGSLREVFKKMSLRWATSGMEGNPFLGGM